MPSSGQRYYWDANVFITLISDLSTPQAIADRQNCSLILQGAMDGQFEIVTSTVSMVEILDTEENVVRPIPESVRQKIRDLLAEPYIVLVVVDAARAAEARELRWDHSWLKTPDAIHVVSAIFAKVDEMHTYDGRGTKRGILNLDGLVGQPALKIIQPGYQGQLRMS